MSIRGLRCLQCQYRHQGVDGLQRQVCLGQGQLKVSERWQTFILKAYKEGNQGQRVTSRSQIAKLVKSYAAEQDDRASEPHNACSG